MSTSRSIESPFCSPPADFSLSEVEVRLATPQERPDWDALMDRHHYLGFRRLAACGLRYVAVWRGRRVALAGWQGGAFESAPRDRWIGWKPKRQFRRLDLIANNTRFLVLSEPGVFPDLASFFLTEMTRRLGDDRLAVHGHRVLLAETFCDPKRFSGAMYRAAGWKTSGETKGCARCNGRHADPHHARKLLLMHPPRRDARRLLSREAEPPPAVVPRPTPDPAGRDPKAMRSLHDELADVADFRRPQGRKHTTECVLAVHVLAEIHGMKGRIGAAQFARSMSREQLAAIGAWRNPKTGLREPVSKSTLHRVVQSVDQVELEAVVRRHSKPRIPLARALAADGKCIRGASRNGDDHHATVALVDHATGMPFALLNLGEEGGELAATHDLPERCDIRGKVVTFDALYTVRNTARLVTERCGADYVFAVKGNAPETAAALAGIDWERDRDGHFAEEPVKAHGRIEWRRIDVPTPLPKAIDHPGVGQIARVTRYGETVETGKADTTYLITSLTAEEASPKDLLALNRGHRWVENMTHRRRDCMFGEDACPTRTGHGPNDRALAVILVDRTGSR